MSLSGNKEKTEGSTMGSPMDYVFSWSESTPIGKSTESVVCSKTASAGGSSGSLSAKRKKRTDDSGYISTSGGSGTQSSFDLHTDGDGTSIGSETPFSFGVLRSHSDIVGGMVGHQEMRRSKKRLIACSEEQESLSSEVGFTSCSSPVVNVVDSYSEFLGEASLYTEPMDTSEAAVPSVFCQHSTGLLKPESELTEEIVIGMELDATPLLPPVKRPQQQLPPSTPDKSRDIVVRQLPRRKLNLSLVGFERVDLLYELGERQRQSLVVSKILGYLSDSDVSNMTMVSKSWKNICLSDSKTKARWLNYITDRKQRKENLMYQNINKIKRSSTPLLNVNHSTPLHIRPQPTSPPVSPSKVRFHLFQKEARNLKLGETLMKCPKCWHPSTCSPALRLGQCKRISCQMRFCTLCKSNYHETSPCSRCLTPTNSPTKKRVSSVSSRDKKRFLRRL